MFNEFNELKHFYKTMSTKNKTIKGLSIFLTNVWKIMKNILCFQILNDSKITGFKSF